MYDNVKVRIVKFVLSSGEIETLMTNLFDLNESEFKELYFKRWRSEVKYDVVKNKLEMPCFGGFSENVIMQDFWISMYLANMAAIAKNEADEKIKAERADSENKYECPLHGSHPQAVFAVLSHQFPAVDQRAERCAVQSQDRLQHRSRAV